MFSGLMSPKLALLALSLPGLMTDGAPVLTLQSGCQHPEMNLQFMAILKSAVAMCNGCNGANPFCIEVRAMKKIVLVDVG